MHRIVISLGYLSEGITQIEEYENRLREKLNLFLSRLLESGVNIARATVMQLGAIDNGELQNSLAYVLYKEGNRGIIFTDCLHACYVEFGTGIMGSASPHPVLPWEYDTAGHGENGWYYYDVEQDRVRFTKGMPSRPFMYETAKELERRAVEIAREVFSR